MLIGGKGGKHVDWGGQAHWPSRGADHDLAITVLKYIRHLPIKKLKFLCTGTTHTNKLR